MPDERYEELKMDVYEKYRSGEEQDRNYAEDIATVRGLQISGKILNSGAVEPGDLETRNHHSPPKYPAGLGSYSWEVSFGSKELFSKKTAEKIFFALKRIYMDQEFQDHHLRFSSDPDAGHLDLEKKKAFKSAFEQFREKENSRNRYSRHAVTSSDFTQKFYTLSWEFVISKEEATTAPKEGIASQAIIIEETERHPVLKIAQTKGPRLTQEVEQHTGGLSEWTLSGKMGDLMDQMDGLEKLGFDKMEQEAGDSDRWMTFPDVKAFLAKKVRSGVENTGFRREAREENLTFETFKGNENQPPGWDKTAPFERGGGKEPGEEEPIAQGTWARVRVVLSLPREDQVFEVWKVAEKEIQVKRKNNSKTVGSVLSISEDSWEAAKLLLEKKLQEEEWQGALREATPLELKLEGEGKIERSQESSSLAEVDIAKPWAEIVFSVQKPSYEEYWVNEGLFKWRDDVKVGWEIVEEKRLDLRDLVGQGLALYERTSALPVLEEHLALYENARRTALPFGSVRATLLGGGPDVAGNHAAKKDDSVEERLPERQESSVEMESIGSRVSPGPPTSAVCRVDVCELARFAEDPAPLLRAFGLSEPVGVRQAADDRVEAIVAKLVEAIEDSERPRYGERDSEKRERERTQRARKAGLRTKLRKGLRYWYIFLMIKSTFSTGDDHVNALNAGVQYHTPLLRRRNYLAPSRTKTAGRSRAMCSASRPAPPIPTAQTAVRQRR